jgi:hypothetical protein
MLPSHDLMHRRRRLRQVVSSEPLHCLDDDSWPRRAIEGVIVDASPHVIVLARTDGSEARLPMSATASIWYDGKAELAALRPGRHAVVRPTEAGGLAAERIWVDVARVTGVITGRVGNRFEVDAGPHRGQLTVTVPDHVPPAGPARRRPAAAPDDTVGPARLGDLVRGSRRRTRRGVPGPRPPWPRRRLRRESGRPAAVPLAGQRAVGPQRVHGSGGPCTDHRVRLPGRAVLRPLCAVRHLPARPGRRTVQDRVRRSGW